MAAHTRLAAAYAMETKDTTVRSDSVGSRGTGMTHLSRYIQQTYRLIKYVSLITHKTCLAGYAAACGRLVGVDIGLRWTSAEGGHGSFRVGGLAYPPIARCRALGTPWE